MKTEPKHTPVYGQEIHCSHCNNYERVLAQRDELAAALEYAENELQHLSSGHIAMRNVNLALDKARAALAKLENPK